MALGVWISQVRWFGLFLDCQMLVRLTSDYLSTVFPWIVAPKVMYTFFSSLSRITLHIEMSHHFNYRSTRTIWFSKILLFSIIAKIFSYKIALEINNRSGYYSRQCGISNGSGAFIHSLTNWQTPKCVT